MPHICVGMCVGGEHGHASVATAPTPLSLQPFNPAGAQGFRRRGMFFWQPFSVAQPFTTLCECYRFGAGENHSFPGPEGAQVISQGCEPLEDGAP